MEFIPLAEETGLISAIGEWVLRTVCTQNKNWQDAGYGPLLMKVNFSASQFYHQNIPELVKRVLWETSIDAGFLDIEITESIATEDHSIMLLNELSRMGISISIDDFGTGYSSLGSLIRLPVNTLKIDKSFVGDIMTDPNAKAIVKAIIAMAHNLDMKVLAEGVETEEQLDFLRSHYCEEVQGYYYSQPVSADEFVRLLEKDLN
jgi:EAL domain-containing protein (putative c-di-GMP-specific phosphodiesterase class I)